MSGISKTAWAARLLGAVVLSAATVPLLGVAPASAAETTTVLASTQGYFNASSVDKPDQSPQSIPNVSPVDGVDKDHLAVAAKGGTEDKVSALLFDLGLEPGSVVTKAMLTLTLGEGNGNLQLSAAAAKVRACAAGDTGFGGEDAVAMSVAPARLCKAFAAPGKDSVDKKGYVFDITGLASTWVDGPNDGLMLTAAEGADSTNFQVVFKPGFSHASLVVEYTPPVEETVAPFVPAPIDTGGTTSGGSFGGEFIPPPTDSFNSGGTLTAPEPAPAPAPVAPEAAAPVAAPAAVVPVSLETLRPTTAFWLAGLVFAGLLILLSLIMGDSSVATATTRPSRLTRALADRRSTSSLGRPAMGRPIAL